MFTATMTRKELNRGRTKRLLIVDLIAAALIVPLAYFLPTHGLLSISASLSLIPLVLLAVYFTAEIATNKIVKRNFVRIFNEQNPGNSFDFGPKGKGLALGVTEANVFVADGWLTVEGKERTPIRAKFTRNIDGKQLTYYLQADSLDRSTV